MRAVLCFESHLLEQTGVEPFGPREDGAKRGLRHEGRPGSFVSDLVFEEEARPFLQAALPDGAQRLIASGGSWVGDPSGFVAARIRTLATVSRNPAPPRTASAPLCTIPLRTMPDGGGAGDSPSRNRWGRGWRQPLEETDPRAPRSLGRLNEVCATKVYPRTQTDHPWPRVAVEGPRVRLAKAHTQPP